ncbi:MAG: response regulator [Nitrospirae bacterium]|nr:response regulator [Nitrospirota bacterium]
MKKILIVDDEMEIRDDLSEILKDSGYFVEKAVSGDDALLKVNEQDFDIILLDLMMPGMPAMDALNEIRKILPKVKIIIITAYSTIGSAIESIKRGASDYVSKPFRIEELLSIISCAVEESKFEQDILDLDFDSLLYSIINPIRRRILKMLDINKKLRFIDILDELGMKEDHQKVVFHLRMLKNADIVEQNKDKSYTMTREGEMVFKSLIMFEKYLTGD